MNTKRVGNRTITLVVLVPLILLSGSRSGLYARFFRQQHDTAQASPARAPLVAAVPDKAAAADPAPPVCYDLAKTFAREVGNYRVSRGALPVEPFEIMDGLYYVGNTQVGAHLLKTTDGLILFDTTMPHEVAWLLESIRQLGFKPADVKVVVGNHAHVDHIGGHWYFQHHFGAQTWLHEIEAPETESGRWQPGEVPLALDGSLEALAQAYPGFRTDRKLKEGETVEWGGRKITFTAAPGHTSGTMMIEFLLQGPDGKNYRAGMLGGIAPGRPEFTETCRKLRDLAIDVPLGAHPNQNGTFAKAAELKVGKTPHPFIDPQGWKDFLDKMIARGAGRGGVR